MRAVSDLRVCGYGDMQLQVRVSSYSQVALLSSCDPSQVSLSLSPRSDSESGLIVLVSVAACVIKPEEALEWPPVTAMARPQADLN